MIKQAIIPLAGLGTRLLPLTSVMPKELLPINGKPNIEYILEECLEAGIKEFIFIISKNKFSIKKYFFKTIILCFISFSMYFYNMFYNYSLQLFFTTSKTLTTLTKTHRL